MFSNSGPTPLGALLQADDASARLTGLLDLASDAILTIDSRQRIVQYNRAAERIFGRSSEQMLGQPLDILIPAQFQLAHREHVKRFGTTGVTSRHIGGATMVHGVRANGEQFPLDASISQIDTHDGKLFTVILRDISERVRLQDELSRFALQAHTSIESEKTRVARELHDELAQSLTALKMDAIWMRDNLPAGTQPLAAKMDGMLTVLDASVAATRRIAADLRPLMLDDLGLVAAIQWLVQSFSQRTGVACELLVNEELELAEPYATALFRIVQESLANVAKHANATQASVIVERAADAILLKVSDNGNGFATQAPRKLGSLGLMGLRERAELLRGSVKIDSQTGGGTRISVNIPLCDPGAAS
jgi:PAS domain S-box-containing protein